MKIEIKYYSADTQTRTLARRLSNHNAFCKRINNIYKFEDCLQKLTNLLFPENAVIEKNKLI